MSAAFSPPVHDSLPELPPAPARFAERILVVEDEHDLRQLTAAVLTDAGYQVDVAENGATAWDALQLAKYDLLFADQFMPKLSGVQLLKKIHDARMPMPVILATGVLPTWEFSLHTWLQPAKMLLKPYSFEKLLGMIKSALPAAPIKEGANLAVAAMAAEASPARLIVC